MAALCLSAYAQHVPKSAEFKDICDTLSVRLKERTGVDSKLSIYQVLRKGTKLNLYFTNTLSDYPWHKEDMEWFINQVSTEMKALTSDFTLGQISTKNNSFSELCLPHITNDGRQSEYSLSCEDPRDLNRNRFIERIGARKYPKGLTDRYIALWQSHGKYFNETDSVWRFQRAPLFGTVEDMYTQSYVLPFLIPMLENSGAYVMTPRERDIQWREIIIDNDPSFTSARTGKMRKEGTYNETGNWKDAGEGFADTKPVYTFSDNPFRNGTARMSYCSEKADAAVIWTPKIEEKGEYAVYVSYRSLPESNRAAHYSVSHLGGRTEFYVNQTKGGGTWIYLGTFLFDKGTGGNVTLDNGGKGIVTADAVKIGGGMGKLERGGSTSGVPSYAEGGHYWMQWAGTDTTITRKWPTDYTNDFATRGAWTEMMRKEKGIPFDLSLAFHSNAGTAQLDSTVGTLAIYSFLWENKRKFDDGRSRMLSRLLAEYVQDEVVSDIRSDFEPEWTRKELWDRSYSESRTTSVPGMLLELLSHQNFADMKYGLDPAFRFTVCRSVYKGILKTLSAFYNTPYVVQPLPVNSFSAVLTESGKVRLEWRPTADEKEPTAKASGYVLYTRIDDGAFDKGMELKGNNLEMSIIPGHIYSFKVTAFNEGGCSFPSEILSVGIPKLRETGKEVLIVNNFDRVSAPAWIDLPDYGGFDYKVDGGVPYIRDISYIGEIYEFSKDAAYVSDDNPGFGASMQDKACSIIAGNSFDYPYVHGRSLLALGYAFSSMSAAAFCEKSVSAPVLDLICGKQQTTRIGRRAVPDRFKVFPDEMKDAITRFTKGGGSILISGANIASDDMDSDFTQKVLGYKFVTSFATSDGRIGRYVFFTEPNSEMYCVERPDELAPAGLRSRTIMRYPASNISGAVLFKGMNYKVVSVGVPVETVTKEADRTELFKELLQALRAN